MAGDARRRRRRRRNRKGGRLKRKVKARREEINRLNEEQVKTRTTVEGENGKTRTRNDGGLKRKVKVK